MDRPNKFWTGFLKFILIVIAASVPVIISSTNSKTDISGRSIRFQKSIHTIPKQRGPMDPQLLNNRYENLSGY